MPYKEAIGQKVESNSAALIKKSKYKVANWNAYNKSLQKRGKLSLYFPKCDLRSQFINDDSYSKGTPGRTALYSGAYIEVILYQVPFIINYNNLQTTEESVILKLSKEE